MLWAQRHSYESTHFEAPLSFARHGDRGGSRVGGRRMRRSVHDRRYRYSARHIQFHVGVDRQRGHDDLRGHDDIAGHAQRRHDGLHVDVSDFGRYDDGHDHDGVFVRLLLKRARCIHDDVDVESLDVVDCDHRRRHRSSAGRGMTPHDGHEPFELEWLGSRPEHDFRRARSGVDDLPCREHPKTSRSSETPVPRLRTHKLRVGALLWKPPLPRAARADRVRAREGAAAARAVDRVRAVQTAVARRTGERSLLRAARRRDGAGPIESPRATVVRILGSAAANALGVLAAQSALARGRCAGVVARLREGRRTRRGSRRFARPRRAGERPLHHARTRPAHGRRGALGCGGIPVGAAPRAVAGAPGRRDVRRTGI